MKNIFTVTFLFLFIGNLLPDQQVLAASQVEEVLVPSANAMDEWTALRKSEDSEKGKIVVWEVQIWNTHEHVYLYGGPGAWLKGNYEYKVVLLGKETNTFKVKDTVVVKGKFMGVNDDGEVLLKVLKYKKTGVVTD